MGAVGAKQGSDKEHTGLNEKEIKLIEASWNSIPNKEEFGISIMIRIFQEHKEIKDRWIFATNLVTEAEMLSNSQLRYHANKITGMFVQIITKIAASPEAFNKDNLDSLGIHRLGKSHHHYGVKKEDFKHFEESLLFSLKKHVNSECWNSKAEKAWLKAFAMVSEIMVNGIETQENLSSGMNAAGKKELA